MGIVSSSRMSAEDPTWDIYPARFINRQLKVADRAVSCLSQGRQSDALHDFRVALRRIRTYLRLHQDEIKGSRHVLRKLRKLMDASDVARDAEVWLALLDRLAEGCRHQEQDGITHIRNYLNEHLGKATLRAHTAIEEGYTSVRHDLHDLAKDNAGKKEILLDRQLLDLWQNLDSALCKLLPEIETDSAHRARLCTKRLRYILESERDQLALPAMDEAITTLKSVQTLLGEWRDAMLFGDWLTEAAATCCGGQAREMIQAALHDDIRGFAALQAHELLSGLVYLATRLNAHLESLRHQLRAWLQGPDQGKLQSFFNQLIISPGS